MRKIFITIIFFITLLKLFSIENEYGIRFLDNNRYYNFILKDKNSIVVTTQFNTLVQVDNLQHHRVILKPSESVKLKTLGFVGDRYEFNDIEITLIAINKFLIRDKIYDFSITFGIGDYESIVIYTYLNFDGDRGERLNKIATCMTVKELLERMNGRLSPNFVIPDYLKFDDYIKITDQISNDDKKIFSQFYQIDQNNSYYTLTKIGSYYENRVIINDILSKIGYEQKNGYVDKNKIENYKKFIEQLKRVDRYEMFNYLKRYIELNFTVTLDNSYESDWINPYDLYYFKKANYKSIAFFYFYILKELNFNVKYYIVIEKVKKDRENLIKLSKLNQQEKEELQNRYKYVKSSYNLDELIYFGPPDLKRAKFLVSVEKDGKWIYSSGGVWVDNNLYKPERTVFNFMGKGCYYTEVENYNNIINNQPFLDREFEWDVFYDSK